MKPNQNFIVRGTLVSLMVFLSSSLPFAFAESPGTTAANFLKIGSGARGAGMGDAQSAVTDDVNSSYWNPAGLSRLRYQEVSLMHYQLFEGVRYQQAQYGFPSEKYGSFSFGANYLNYGDIKGYDVNSAPTGNVNASNLLMSVGWGKTVNKSGNLALGSTFKYLQSSLAGYSASVPMLDLGLQYQPKTEILKDVHFAGTLRNLGPQVNYAGLSSPLPRQFVLGAGYSGFGGNLKVDVDSIKPRDSKNYVAAGVEYKLFSLLLLRLGYTSKADFIGSGVSYGMGLRFNQWNIDYAFVPYGDLGNTNRISVGIRFGKAMQMKDASDQVDFSYNKAQSLYAHGNAIDAYSMLNDLLLIAPWHKPSVELKAKIEKQFSDMSVSKNQAKLDAEIADKFTESKAAFDRDELVQAKKGFETILQLQPDHTGAKVYLERITNRYASLAYESFKQGMAFYAAGEYEKAKALFEKTLTIDENHTDARAQLETTKQMIADSTKRAQEMARLAGAADAYKDGLTAYQKNDLELALKKFEEVKGLMPEYEEVGRYLTLTKTSLANILFDQSRINTDNGQLDEAVTKLKRALSLNPQDHRIQPALDIASRDLAAKNAQDSRKVYQEGLDAYLSGNTEKAVKNWKRALELDSTNDDAQKALQKLEEQKAYEKSKQDQ